MPLLLLTIFFHSLRAIALLTVNCDKHVYVRAHGFTIKWMKQKDSGYSLTVLFIKKGFFSFFSELIGLERIGTQWLFRASSLPVVIGRIHSFQT